MKKSFFSHDLKERAKGAIGLEKVIQYEYRILGKCKGKNVICLSIHHLKLLTQFGRKRAEILHIDSSFLMPISYQPDIEILSGGWDIGSRLGQVVLASESEGPEFEPQQLQATFDPVLQKIQQKYSQPYNVPLMIYFARCTLNFLI